LAHGKVARLSLKDEPRRWLEERANMTTEKELIDTIKKTRIDWDATPRSVLGSPAVAVLTHEGLEQLQQ
jgi:hypothetical protein